MHSTQAPVNQPVKAGFPNAAEDAPQHSLNLHELLIKRPASTFFMRVEGDFMQDMGIYTSDLLIIDKSLEKRSGDIVVAYVDGQFLVRRYIRRGDAYLLETTHARSKPIGVEGSDIVHIWGVVTTIVHHTRGI